MDNLTVPIPGQSYCITNIASLLFEKMLYLWCLFPVTSGAVQVIGFRFICLVKGAASMNEKTYRWAPGIIIALKEGPLA